MYTIHNSYPYLFQNYSIYPWQGIISIRLCNMYLPLLTRYSWHWSICRIGAHGFLDWAKKIEIFDSRNRIIAPWNSLPIRRTRWCHQLLNRPCWARDMMEGMTEVRMNMVPGLTTAKVTLHLPLDGIDRTSSDPTVFVWRTRTFERRWYFILFFKVVCLSGVQKGVGFD